MSLEFDPPTAPDIVQEMVTCPNCGNATHLILAKCPDCQQVNQYFHTDLDFVAEVKTLAEVYVNLIKGIRSCINDYIAEFNVTMPKRWSAKLTCDCGTTFNIEVPLPQLVSD